MRARIGGKIIVTSIISQSGIGGRASVEARQVKSVWCGTNANNKFGSPGDIKMAVNGYEGFGVRRRCPPIWETCKSMGSQRTTTIQVGSYLLQPGSRTDLKYVVGVDHRVILHTQNRRKTW